MACPFGAEGVERIAHGLQACIDEHWPWGDDEFAVLKIDEEFF